MRSIPFTDVKLPARASRAHRTPAGDLRLAIALAVVLWALILLPLLYLAG